VKELGADYEQTEKVSEIMTKKISSETTK